MNPLLDVAQSPSLGCERETVYHVTVLSNFVRGFDKYRRVYSKVGIPESSFPDKFFLLRKEELGIGIKKAGALIEKIGIPTDRLIAISASLEIGRLKKNERTGLGRYIESADLPVEAVFYVGSQNGGKWELLPLQLEEACSASFRLLNPSLLAYNRLLPRTVSVLPIARACQAECAFCFSQASVSLEQQPDKPRWDRIETIFKQGKVLGAERMVITGGGEPGLLQTAELLKLTALGAAQFRKVVLITNGYFLARMREMNRVHALRSLADKGLSVLAVSRHHHDEEKNAQIMRLNTGTADVAGTWLANQKGLNRLKMRLICVLQKGAIDGPATIKDYLDWAAGLGIEEVCFKELYVSTGLESVYHDAGANEWSRKNQVPLALLVEFLELNGFAREAELPWGAPVYIGTWNGHPMRIAAYTEPSLYWERCRGLCRSWNIMADGRCLASLEDRNSEVMMEHVL